VVSYLQPDGEKRRYRLADSSQRGRGPAFQTRPHDRRKSADLERFEAAGYPTEDALVTRPFGISSGRLTKDADLFYFFIVLAEYISRKSGEKAMSLVANAEAFARRCHAGQFRKGAAREAYTIHLEEVAGLVSRWGGVESEIAAAWLHDTVEDCPPICFEDIETEFGISVATIVQELTDDKSLPKEERKRLQIENAPKKSLSAALVKLADKTSNVGALTKSPPPDWSRERRLTYVAWAETVVLGLPTLPRNALDEFFKRCDFAILKANEDLGTSRQVQNAVFEILTRKAKRSGASEKATEKFMTAFFQQNL
jgi:(p)ppGpp synthase/HD superfamily hydrolase